MSLLFPLTFSFAFALDPVCVFDFGLCPNIVLHSRWSHVRDFEYHLTLGRVPKPSFATFVFISWVMIRRERAMDSWAFMVRQIATITTMVIMNQKKRNPNCRIKM
jgi:hypothetical protein